MPITPGAEPWAHEGGPLAVLLVHGFNGSPQLLRSWGARLAAEGLTVLIPRLPGHGSSWREANLTRWPDWYAQVDRTFSELRRTHDQVVVGGFAMGGVLALRLAARRGDELSGLILVNPSILSEEPRAGVAHGLSRVVPAWPARAPDLKDPDVGRLDHPTRVPSRAFESLAELRDEVRPLVPGVTVPTLLLTSVEDHVVAPENGDWVASQIGSPDLTRVMLPDSYHLAPIDGDRDLVASASLSFIGRLTREREEIGRGSA